MDVQSGETVNPGAPIRTGDGAGHPFVYWTLVAVSPDFVVPCETTVNAGEENAHYRATDTAEWAPVNPAESLALDYWGFRAPRL